ncbi:MAG: DUF1501 domain-containing protein [Rhodospirillaceae bacterium]
MSISRRNLLSALSAGVGFAIAPGVRATFAQSAPSVPSAARDILVVVFQRGACDWLQMIAPAGDADYIANRPSIRVRTDGNTPGIGLATMNGVDLYLNPAVPELKTLYDSGKLAFVHATGLYTQDRSHFTCQDNMEKGTADADPAQNSGWLTRHTQSVGVPDDLSIVSSGSTNAVSLLGQPAAVAIADPNGFNVSGGTANANIIRLLNSSGNASPYQTAALKTLDTIRDVQAGLAGFQDPSGSAGYTGGPLSNALRAVGRLVRMNVGLDVVTVDHGGWDHHNNLVNEFNARATEFSRSINAFWTDMANYRDRITLVTMTEFGRRFRENANQGTDHGSASGMLILGGSVNGGRTYGVWPGLRAAQLDSGDMAITTDYRQVLAELLVKRHAETDIRRVFPTITYSPMGIVNA